MPRISTWLPLIATIGLLTAGVSARAQQATITTPMQGVSDSFFENTGVGFSLSGRNWFFNNGGGVNAAAPPFGNFDPNAGANLGFGLRFPGGTGFLNFGAAQGSSRSISSVAPSVTVMDGATGTFAAGTLQPFVVGFIPVVGNGGGAAGIISGPYPTSLPPLPSFGIGPTMLDERLARIREGGGFKFSSGQNSSGAIALATHDNAAAANDPVAVKLAAAKTSSAGQPAAGLQQIRQQQTAADDATSKEAQSLLKQGREAQAVGKLQVARIFYQQAAKRATGKLLEDVQEAQRSLENSRNFSSGQ
ncbi:MAG TPA: hypothetical protein VGJ15_03545 [Pirellulales bacterium]